MTEVVNIRQCRYFTGKCKCYIYITPLPCQKKVSMIRMSDSFMRTVCTNCMYDFEL